MSITNSHPKTAKVPNKRQILVELDYADFRQIEAEGVENERKPGTQARHILKQWAKARKTLKGQS